MRKFLTFCLLLGVSFGIAPVTYAFEASALVNNQAPAATINFGTFDNLVLDVTLSTGNPDTLSAIAVKNIGSANEINHIKKMVLWADSGAAGFQGMGIDTKLGEMKLQGEQVWYLDALAQTFINTTRLFVSVEAAASYSTSAYIQMRIMPLLDQNGNGIFDYGDQGIFLASKNNGPVSSEAITNINSQTFSTNAVDSIGPKITLSNLAEGQAIATGDFTINGYVRDQGGTYLRDLTITIDGQVSDITTVNFETNQWTHLWSAVAAGTHTVTVEGHDGIGNYTKVGPITITAAAVTTPEPTPTPTPEPEPTTVPRLQGVEFGGALKGSASTLYYYGHDGKRYVFPDEKTWISWGGTVPSITPLTADLLSQVPLAGAVTHRPGSLVKIQTDPKVYAVDKGGVLRWIETEAAAVQIYGVNWAIYVKDVIDSYFTAYTIGTSIKSSADFSPAAAQAASPNISVDKGL